MFSDWGWKDGGGAGKKFPIASRGVGLVGIVPRLYTQIPKNFFKTKRGSGSAKHPRGTYCVVYPLLYNGYPLCVRICLYFG